MRYSQKLGLFHPSRLQHASGRHEFFNESFYERKLAPLRIEDGFRLCLPPVHLPLHAEDESEVHQSDGNEDSQRPVEGVETAADLGTEVVNTFIDAFICGIEPFFQAFHIGTEAFYIPLYFGTEGFHIPLHFGTEAFYIPLYFGTEGFHIPLYFGTETFYIPPHFRKGFHDLPVRYTRGHLYGKGRVIPQWKKNRYDGEKDKK